MLYRVFARSNGKNKVDYNFTKPKEFHGIHLNFFNSLIIQSEIASEIIEEIQHRI